MEKAGIISREYEFPPVPPGRPIARLVREAGQPSSTMSLPPRIKLRSRSDQFSFQVDAASDDRFWFRLVREEDRDVITDYSLGSFPRELSGILLTECYRTLGLTPRDTLLFRDIAPGRSATDAGALDEARDLYESAAGSMLAQFGLRITHRQTAETRGKTDLLILAAPTHK